MEKLKREESMEYVAARNVVAKIDELVDFVNKQAGQKATQNTKPPTTFPDRDLVSQKNIMSTAGVCARFRDVGMLFQSYGGGVFVYHAWHGEYSIYATLSNRDGLLVDASELKRFGDVAIWDGVCVFREKRVIMYEFGTSLPDHVA